MNRPLLDPTAEEECRALRHAIRCWRTAAVFCLVVALVTLAILITAHGEQRHQAALPIKGMIVCLSLKDVALIKANGGKLP